MLDPFDPRHSTEVALAAFEDYKRRGRADDMVFLALREVMIEIREWRPQRKQHEMMWFAFRAGAVLMPITYAAVLAWLSMHS